MKKVAFISVVIILFITGISIIIGGENQINSQKAEIVVLQQTIKEDKNQISILNKKNASESAQITTLLTQPSATAGILYKTNAGTIPDSNNSQIQQKLDTIEKNQQDAEMRAKINCLDNGGLYSSVSGCNH